MIHLRSPFDRSVADTMHWGRFIDKIRLHQLGELPKEYSEVLGHKLGVDGTFLKHFGLTIEQVTQSVAGKSDPELALWIERVVDNFPAKSDSWNDLAPDLGKEGTAMHRAFKFAIKRYFPDGDAPAAAETCFGLIEFDEGRA